MSTEWPSEFQAIAIVFVALSISACGAGGGSDKPRSVLAAPPGLSVRDDGSVHISQDWLNLLPDELPREQRDVLADGLLTIGEYGDAHRRSVDCAKSLGFTIEEQVPPSAVRSARFSASYPGTVTEDLRQRFARCRTQFTSELQRIWEYTHGPSESDLQRARDAMGTCLRHSGEHVVEHPGPDDFSAYLREAQTARFFAECMREVEAEFGFPLG